MVPVMRWWKVAGLAGLAGVAATGVVVARGERLRARAAEAGVERAAPGADPAAG
jgi:hypothetical protein